MLAYWRAAAISGTVYRMSYIAEIFLQTLIRLFLKGLATLVPIVLTLAILIWLGGMAEQGMGAALAWLLPEGLYIPGTGLVVGLALVIGVGILSQNWLFQRIFDLGESLLNRLPLVKTVYRAIKDFVEYFSHSKDANLKKVVQVRHPDLPVSMIGFITREDFSQLPFGSQHEVAVYLPMSYQIGGYTLILPREWITPLDIPFEDAMRLVVTGGVARQAQD